MTLHKRQDSASDVEELVHHLNEGLRHIILLPRPFDLMPPAIARHLIEAGIPAGRPVTVYQRLTLEGEQEWTGILGECAELSDDLSDLSIMVFFSPMQERSQPGRTG